MSLGLSGVRRNCSGKLTRLRIHPTARLGGVSQLQPTLPSQHGYQLLNARAAGWSVDKVKTFSLLLKSRIRLPAETPMPMLIPVRGASSIKQPLCMHRNLPSIRGQQPSNNPRMVSSTRRANYSQRFSLVVDRQLHFI